MRIIAHRGGHTSARQNTLGAYRAALADGADAAELDVRLSRDRTPVLGHDPVQWRGPRPYLVAGTPARRLGFLATLEQVVAEPRTGGHAVPIVLDVKRSADLPAVAAWCLGHVADADRIALWCRDPARIAALPGRDSFGEVALLPSGRRLAAYLDDAARAGAHAVSLHPEMLDADAVGRAQRRGLRAYAWIRSRAAHRAAVDLGVDGLVTDWIDEALRAAGRPIPGRPSER